MLIFANKTRWNTTSYRPAFAWVLTSLTVVAAAAGGRLDQENVSLTCKISVLTGIELELECILQNNHDRDILVSYDGPVLEGPTSDLDDYLYHYTGGERCENVLNYYISGVGDLGRMPILLKPYVHLDRKQIKNLVRLSKGNAHNIKILWRFEIERDLLRTHEWLLQLKIMYALDKSLLTILEKTDLESTCRKSIEQALQDDLKNGIVEMIAYRAPLTEGTSYAYDGCRDIVSEKFRYTYSNTILFTLTP